MMKLELPYETADSIFLAMLYEGYETAYWTLRDAEAYYNKDPDRNKFKLEDIRETTKVLAAYVVLGDHYSAGGVDNGKLKEIRDRIDYKYRIAKGMSNV